jgi:hypothetical protein
MAPSSSPPTALEHLLLLALAVLVALAVALSVL